MRLFQEEQFYILILKTDVYFAKGISLHKFDKSSSSMSKRYSQILKNPFVEKDYVRGNNLPFVYGLTFTKSEWLFIVTLHRDSKTRFSQSKTLKFII